MLRIPLENINILLKSIDQSCICSKKGIDEDLGLLIYEIIKPNLDNSYSNYLYLINLITLELLDVTVLGYEEQVYLISFPNIYLITLYKKKYIHVVKDIEKCYFIREKSATDSLSYQLNWLG